MKIKDKQTKIKVNCLGELINLIDALYVVWENYYENCKLGSQLVIIWLGD